MKDFTQRLYDHKCHVIEQLHSRGLVLGRDYHVEGVYLQGSQNYNVHTDKSDVDSKMVVIPTLRSLIRDTKLTVDMDVPCEDGSVEKCSVKPYKEFEALFFKGNFNKSCLQIIVLVVVNLQIFFAIVVRNLSRLFGRG